MDFEKIKEIIIPEVLNIPSVVVFFRRSIFYKIYLFLTKFNLVYFM